MYRNIENPMRKGMPLALAVAFASVMAGSAMAQNNNTTPANPGSDDTEKVQAGAVDPKVLKTQSIPGLPSGPGAVANSSGTVELAIREFGMMAAVVFKQWGVRRTDDVGEIVFKLIKAHRLSKSDRDDPDDFHDLFDLNQALTDGFALTLGDTAKRGDR